DLSVFRESPNPSLFQVHLLKLNRLSIDNFRSFDNFALDVGGRSLFIISENGGGKTSLISALAMPGTGGKTSRQICATRLRRGRGGGGDTIRDRCGVWNTFDSAALLGSGGQA